MRLAVAFAIPVLVGMHAAGAAAQEGREPIRLPTEEIRAASQDPDHPIFEEGRRTMVAERLEEGEELRLDGRLDEPFWDRAIPAADFIMQEPDLGGTPTEATEVRIAFDENNLYMGVMAFDSEPHRRMGNTMKRDEFLGADDRFMWTIDTFLDQQTGYFFEMNPSGLMADAVMGAGGGNNREWDGIWDARPGVNEQGWTLEIVIPFRTLNFDPNAAAWGINFQRTVRRKNEESLWTGHQRNQGLRRMTNAGLVVGIQDVSQGLGLDVRPYVVAKTQEAPGRVPALDDETTADVGVDLYYNLTPNLRANLTINTDFAETEVDQRQVNLTRFPLFFPEKRGFFLEGQTFFDFNAPNSELRPFFSRRIGLTGGVPQAVNGGLKLTGQVGQNDIGALVVQTRGDDDLIGEDYAVFRARRRFGQSFVGGIYTMRNGREDGLGAYHTLGTDVRLSTSNFAGTSQNLVVGGMVLATPNPLTEGDELAYSASIDYPNDRWSGNFQFLTVEPNHVPAVGFLRRRGFRSYSPGAAFSPRPTGHPLIRQFRFGASMLYLTDMGGNLLTREVDLQAFSVDTHSGDNFSVSVTPTYEFLDEDFQIYPGVVLPSGTDYNFNRYRLAVRTASSRILSANASYTFGDFFSGNRQDAGLNLGIRPARGVTLALSGERNSVGLPEGDFTTHLFRFIADTQLNPRVYLVNNLQYDSLSDQLGWQGRFRWIVNPGNDIYLVYTHNWLEEVDASGFFTLDRRAAMKINYTRRI